MRQYQHPDREHISLTGVLYGLSDPTRLQIVKMLATNQEITCGEFCLTLSKSTQSHHFKVLRDMGIMHTRLMGTQHYNSLRREDLDARFPNLLEAILKNAD
ncbi:MULTISPECIES: ArsR/SmtB family transcription factor [Pseudanabaena]|uniref:Transcriptional regulator, ArsR family n=2 Tax=Pseudanabaena TaxID=1152 RepID=L8N1P1_9CYAN|nr:MULTISPECIES: helix-turn-helix transcriptional regulator [Pseudanabaena]ELS32650.1 transcriptional regulator, ArsR family [Pseudanabaena biceps PCC 7429]MDG3495109.1 helix-turn-helix transcriptional regulator [Pseudanabaena catenata USMAC16]